MIGLPDPDFGERVVAVVVETAKDAVDPIALKNILARSLAKYKLPKEIITIDTLPRNAMGKVMKKDLRDLISRKHLGMEH